MELDQILAVSGASSALWYPFGLLLLCGLGLPIPEDIVLIAAGFLGAQNEVPLISIVVVMYFGILLGDTIVYCMGRFFGRNVLDTKLGSYLISAVRLQKAEQAFTKYGRWVVFVGRFLPGLRAPIFFSAGLLRFSVFGFWLMDGLAAIVSAPLFVWLGHWAWVRYANDLTEFQRALGQTKLYAGGVLLVVVLTAFFYWKSRAKKNALIEERSQESAP
jgi:membrane protein DedA with SNARE-associated domain